MSVSPKLILEALTPMTASGDGGFGRQMGLDEDTVIEPFLTELVPLKGDRGSQCSHSAMCGHSRPAALQKPGRGQEPDHAGPLITDVPVFGTMRNRCSLLQPLRPWNQSVTAAQDSENPGPRHQEKS